MSSKRDISSITTCPHCGNKGYMDILGHVTDYRKHTHETNGTVHDEWDEGDYWEILKCPACKSEIIRKGYYNENYEPEDHVGPDVIYPEPKSSKDWSFLPEKILAAVQAAHSVKSVDTNAYGVLLGRVLDLVCIDKEAKGDKLIDKINDLSIRHILPGHLKDLSHHLRMLRNFGAHATEGSLTPRETVLLESLCDSILDYIYKGPHILQQAVDQIGKLKTEKKPKD
ncbi:MAG: DUF4145 domain-containing protein [Bacteriovoracaceae bacterium]